MNLSVCMIVKNEDALLRKSLESIKDIADEIIIVDTGSSDKTVEIASEYTDKIYHFKWIEDFSAAMNFCVGHASFPLVLRWDADFVLKEDSLQKLKEIKKRNFDNADVASFTWNIGFGEDDSPTSSIHRWFIYNKNKYHFESKVHSDIVLNNPRTKIISRSYPLIEVNHLKDKQKKAYRYEQTLKIVESMLKKDPSNMRILFSYGEELMFGGRFIEAIEIFNKFLLGEKNDTEKRVLALENLVLCNLSLGKRNDIAMLLKSYSQKYLDNPRFLLSLADTTVLSDLQGAEKLYLNYLTNPVTPKNSIYLFDFERHFIHPHFTLSHIYYKVGNFNKSREHIEIVIKNTKFNERRLKAMMHLEKVTHITNET